MDLACNGPWRCISPDPPHARITDARRSLGDGGYQPRSGHAATSRVCYRKYFMPPYGQGRSYAAPYPPAVGTPPPVRDGFPVSRPNPYLRRLRRRCRTAAKRVLSVTEPMKCGPCGDLFVIHRRGGHRQTYRPGTLPAPPPRPHPALPRSPTLKRHAARRHSHRDCSRRRRRLGRDASALRQTPMVSSCFTTPSYLPTKVFQSLKSSPRIWPARATQFHVKIHTNPESVRVFLPDSKPPRVGDLFEIRHSPRLPNLIARAWSRRVLQRRNRRRHSENLRTLSAAP